MRILLLTHSFNSLTQKLFVALTERDHQLSVEFDINDDVLRSAVKLFKPDVIVAPFLKRAIPADVWQRIPCFIVHPGVVGDRGPSALDWAILRGETEWGVTVLQANEVWDGGPVWSEQRFDLPFKPKGQIYRHELAIAAELAVLSALDSFESGGLPLAQEEIPNKPGSWHEPIRDDDRAIDWQTDSALTVLRKIYSADGEPGAIATLNGERWRLFDAHLSELKQGNPGDILSVKDGAVCVACQQGSIWVGHVTPADRAMDHHGRKKLKLPANDYLHIEPPNLKANLEFSRIRSELIQETAFVYFDFYNGAMSVEHCNTLQEEIDSLHATGMKRLVLMGGSDFWSNGLHLTRIEHADSPADASQQNIEAMDDLCEMLIRMDDVQVCSVLRGNSGAGGVFLALAADVVLAQSHVVLNPHYKSMGNLYGSEFWTYLLPKRLSNSRIKWLMNHRLPLGAEEAMRIGLIDDVLPTRTPSIEQEVLEWLEMHTGNDFFETKKRQRSEDEGTKPLRVYREEELAQMKLNFYGFDPSYHVARYHFVHKTPKSRTPLYLAKHRQNTGTKNQSAERSEVSSASS